MEKLKHLPTIFFAAYLFIGLLILPDYGISTDEVVQVVHAQVQLDYAAEVLTLENYTPYHPEIDIKTYVNRHYSMMYGMFSTFIAEMFGYERGDYRLAWQVRHHVVFCLFWLACLVFYQTLKLRFGGWKWPMLGVVMLVLTPRIFANSFYNPKDIVVLIFYVYATASLFWFLKKRTWTSLLVHAIATGMVLNTRLPAMFLPLMTYVMLVAGLIQNRKGFIRTGVEAVVYGGVSFIVFVALFPYLWEDTFARIAESWNAMAKFNWNSHNRIFNTWIPGKETPFWYIPAWMLITTPLATISLILLGIGLQLKKQTLLLRQLKFWEGLNEKYDLLQLGLGAGPILAVIVLQSNLYNGWRHLYFVYPSLIYLAVLAGQWLLQSLRGRWNIVAKVVLAGNLIWIFAFMVIAHPQQQVYFNLLAGGNLVKRFDVDYWGLSYYEALNKLADNTPEGEITYVRGANIDAWFNVVYLPPEKRAKIGYDFEDYCQGYYLSNFRRPSLHNDYFDKVPPLDNPYYFRVILGDTIMGVFHKQPYESPSDRDN